MARTPRPPSRPHYAWNDPRRWTWVNAFGFALSLFLLIFLLLFAVRTLMPSTTRVQASIPTVYVAASLLACAATVVLAVWVVIGLMARGADLGSVHARHVIVLWSACGLAFALVQIVVTLRFGVGAPMPNVAPGIAHSYWGSGFFALPGFGLMTWANAAHGGGGRDEDAVDADLDEA